jgi:hypothetical protein
MKRLNGLVFGILFLSLITFASASNLNNTIELQKVYSNLKCRADFYSGVINSMNSMQPSDSLNQTSTQLQSDLNQVQTYANSGDRTSLQQYVKSNFESDNSMIKNAITSWRQANVKNFTRDQKQSLLANYNSLKSTFDTCQINSLKDFANARISSFQNSISSYQTKISAYSAKGVDVSSLNQIISDATAQIITPLQNAVSSANDATSINNAIKGYCLFDGCANGINFHLAAKFEIAKLQIAFNKINSNQNVSQTSITQLQTDITTASGILTQVGTGQYTSQQSTNLWNAINDGYSTIKSILNSNKLSTAGNSTQ